MEGGGWILCDSFTVRQVVGGDSSNIFSKILSSGITSVGLIESFVSCFYYCVLFFLLLLLLQFERFLRLMMGEHWTRRCQLFLAPYLQTTVDYFYLESNQTCDQLPTFNTHSRLPDSITYPPPLPPPLPAPFLFLLFLFPLLLTPPSLTRFFAAPHEILGDFSVITDCISPSPPRRLNDVIHLLQCWWKRFLENYWRKDSWKDYRSDSRKLVGGKIPGKDCRRDSWKTATGRILDRRWSFVERFLVGDQFSSGTHPIFLRDSLREKSCPAGT